MQFYSGVSWEGPACELKRDSISQCIRSSNKIQSTSVRKLHLKTIWKESKWPTDVYSIQVVHSPELYIISSKRSYVAQPDRMEKYFPLSLAEGFPLKALQFCAVFVRFVMWMMSYVPMMTLPTWPLLWIGLGPSISALICCDVIVMLLLNALASILCSLTNCLCERALYPVETHEAKTCQNKFIHWTYNHKCYGRIKGNVPNMCLHKPLHMQCMYSI